MKSVPVAVVARLYGKDPSWVRMGIIGGWLPIGYATRDGSLITSPDQIKSNRRINYYISATKLYAETGFMWRGGQNEYDNKT